MMVKEVNISALKEEISLLSASIKTDTDKIISLKERMDTVERAIKGCRLTLQGFDMLKEAYTKARVNDLEAMSEPFDAVYLFCTEKMRRWQQYWIELNNECALLQDALKARQFEWESKRSKYNKAVKVQEKQGRTF